MRSPTEVELIYFPKLQLMSRHEWNPETVLLNKTTTNSIEDRPSLQISKLKISPNIINFKYLDASGDASQLHSIEQSLSNLKEQMLMKVPRNVAEVNQYDDVLEDLSIRQTYTSTKRHSRISAEVLAE